MIFILSLYSFIFHSHFNSKEEEPNRFVCNPLDPTSLTFGPRYSTDPVLRLAFNETDARTVMAQAPYVYRQPISGDDGFRNWFEVGISEMLLDRTIIYICHVCLLKFYPCE